MSRLVQVLALAAFACPLALAGWVVEPEGIECGIDEDCDVPEEELMCVEGPCMEEYEQSSVLQEDEVSLLQVHQDIKLRGDRDWPTPVHDDYAITDSVPDNLDAGEVVDSYDSNLKKVKDSIETKAARKLEFKNTVHKERKESLKAAQKKVAAEQAAVKTAYESDRAAVEKTRKKRERAIKSATERVAQAKEDMEAHRYKEAQAKKAAIEGRIAGTRMADDSVDKASADMQHKWQAADEKEAREDARKAADKQVEDEEAEVNAETKAIESDEESWVKGVGKWKREAEAKSAADAALEENAIEGAEGMKNHMLAHEADIDVGKYSRHSFKAQRTIDAAAKSNYPKGYWPAGP